MRKTVQLLKKKVVEVYVEVGYQQKQLPLLGKSSFLFQFIIVYIMKASLLDETFNPTIHRATAFLVGHLVQEAVVLAVNALLLIPALMFGTWCFLQRIQESKGRVRKTWLSAENLRKAIVGIALFLSPFLVLCLALSIRWIYTMAASTQAKTSMGAIIFIIIMTIFVVALTLLQVREMLLGKGILLVLLCCPGVKWNIPIVKVVALGILLGFLWMRGVPNCHKNLLYRILRMLLSFLFLLDAFMPGISTLFFVMLNLSLAALVASTPEPEFIRDSIEINNIILESLGKMKKEGKLKRRDESRLLPTLFAVQEQYEGMKGLRLGSPLSYEGLCKFFIVKVGQDMEHNKQQSTYRLQSFLFRLRHSELTLQLLHQISTFSRQLRDGFNLEARIQLLGLRRQIEEMFTKREQLNLSQVVEICARIEGANLCLLEALSQLDKFWADVEGQEMTEKQLSRVLSKVAEKEELIQETMLQIRSQTSTSTQARLYCYGLRLLNFNYEMRQQTSSGPEGEADKLASTFFLIAREGLIFDISNQLLMELKKKKQEVKGEKLEAIIPRELVPSIQENFSSVFEHSREEKMVLPFLDLSQQLVPFRVQLEVKLNPQSGIQNVIHFFRSQDLREQSIFLYCADSDKILHISPLFSAFLRRHDRRLEGQLLGVDLFGVELSHVVGSGEMRVGDTVASTLIRQRGRQASLPLTLRIKELFRSGGACLTLIAVESAEGLDEGTLGSTVFSLSNFLERKETANSSKERAQLLKEASEKEEVGICRIPNPYETIIDEKMSKIKLLFRWSYLKVIIILMVALLLLFVVFMVFLTVYAEKVNNDAQRVFRYSEDKLFEVESSYLLFYQFYEYQLIKHYPEFPLSILPYNISALLHDYRTKSNNNIVNLLNSRVKGLILQNKQYTLEFDSYNITKTTSVISMIDFMTDIKQALESGNSTFATRNQHNIETIISAYRPINTFYIQDLIKIMKIGTAFIFAAMLLLSVVIKCIYFQLRSLSRDILEIYEHIPSSVIQKQVTKYRELKSMIQYTGGHIKCQEQSEAEEPMKKEEDVKEKNIRIKKQSLVELIFTNNLVILFCAALFALLFWEIQLLDNYQKDTQLVINKVTFLVDSKIEILKPAEKFFQAAMEERILPSQRRPRPAAGVIDIKVSNIHHELPPYFDSYQIQERDALTSNLCLANNTGLLYSAINCSQILNGILTKNYAETFMIFTSLTRNFTGVGLSKLGETYRQGAVYPVWMEVLFTRDTIANMFKSLKDSFTGRIEGFMKIQKQSITKLLWNALYIIPLLVLLLTLQMKRIYQECRAVIKSFKILPKSYLLKMRTSKFLRQEQVLDKIEAISF